MTDPLWASFSNAHRASTQAETIVDVCGELLSASSILPFTASLDDEEEDWWEGDGEQWVYPYRLKTWRLAARSRKVAGFITVAASFFRPEDEYSGDWEGSKRAKLYVGYTAPPRRSSAWDVDNLYVDAAGQAPQARPASAYTWQSTTDRGQTGWFFCLKLLEIEGRDDLVREVVQPVARLLAEEPEPFGECRSTIRCLRPRAE